MKKKTKRKKRHLKRWVWMLFLILSLIGVFISFYEIINYILDSNSTNAIIENINNTVVVEEIEDNENTEIVNPPEEAEEEDPNNDYWNYIKLPLMNVDFNELIGINRDTVGWINVNNTSINYPFVQTTDNDYYLTHSFDKSYNKSGWLFLDYRNNKDFSNKNTIIYGHSRNDQTMFGTLKNILNQSWYKNNDNRVIKISTQTENTLWQVVSVYKIPSETYYITVNFNTDAEYETFQKTILERSIYNFGTSLNTNDKILTLSTCDSTGKNRIVMHAKLIKRENKNS